MAWQRYEEQGATRGLKNGKDDSKVGDYYKHAKTKTGEHTKGKKSRSQRQKKISVLGNFRDHSGKPIANQGVENARKEESGLPKGAGGKQHLGPQGEASGV